MKKRILSIFAVLAVAVNMVGCTPPNTAAPAEVTEQIIVETTAETIETFEMKTVEPPEDGWTVEQLNEVMYMNGQKVELPLLLSSLDGDYEIRDIEHYDESNRASGTLYYNDCFYAIITFYELDQDYQISTLSFVPTYYKNQDCSNYIKINNFGLNDNTTYISEYLGDKFTKKEGFIIYELLNEEYTILVTDVEKNYMIMIFEGVNRNE